jgi:hypothetical protein
LSSSRIFCRASSVAQLRACVDQTEPSVNRNYLPGHKQGGSVSRHTIDRLAPAIAELYESPRLIDWLAAGSRESPCNYRLPTIRTPMRSISTLARAITSAGTTTPRITPGAATRCCSGSSIARPVVSTINCTPAKRGLCRSRLGAAAARGHGIFRRRQIAAPDHTAASRREARIAHVRVRDRSADEFGRRLISQMKDAVAYFGFRQVFGGVGARRAQRRAIKADRPLP